MSKEHNLRYAREVVGRDPWAAFLGIQVEEVEEFRAVVSLMPQEHHLNAGQRVHGGTIYALVDQAAAVAANSGANRAWTIEGKVNFLAGAQPGVKLVAEARTLDQKRRLSLWEVRVTSGGETVAVAQVMSYNKPRGE